MKQTKEQTKKRVPVWSIVRIGAIIAIGVFMGHYVTTSMEQTSRVQGETADYHARIRNELYLQEEIEREAAFSQSPEFIERVAREHLNLLHPDEIIFRFED